MANFRRTGRARRRPLPFTSLATLGFAALLLPFPGPAAAADEGRRFALDDLEKMVRVSQPRISPDGRDLAYSGPTRSPIPKQGDH